MLAPWDGVGRYECFPLDMVWDVADVFPWGGVLRYECFPLGRCFAL